MSNVILIASKKNSKQWQNVATGQCLIRQVLRYVHHRKTKKKHRTLNLN